MRPERIVRELEKVVEQFGIRIRREKGSFRSGRCTVHNQPWLLLNKQHPIEIHVSVLADCLRDLPVETVFLRPTVRAALEAAWSENHTGASFRDDI